MSDGISGLDNWRAGRPAVTLVLALTLFALLGTALPGQALSPGECHEVNIPRLFLARGGAWTDQGLVVVDVLKQRFLRYDAGANQAEFLTEGAWRYPESVKQQDGHLLVLDEGGVANGQPGPRSQIVRFDGALDKVGTKMGVSGLDLDHLDEIFGAKPAVLEAIYDWSPLGEGILAFGDVSIDGGALWKSAFLYTDAQGNQDVFREFETVDDVCNQYTLTFDYTATVGERGYILLLDRTPKILEVTPGVSEARELPYFPEDFQNRPALETQEKWVTTRQGARQATYFYGILERSTMAAGIYGHDGNLFLLGKKAIDAEGNTAWWLIKLDPNDGSELSRVQLPTHAAHLTVVPGPTFWGLIEKGPVQGIGERHAPYMDTSSVMLIPTDWIEHSEAHPALSSKVTCSQSSASTPARLSIR